ncbi:MAG: hypothetical protein JXA18_02675 [Chitinispirillaceae bacterium]|nr:hypothetical protein [Chitinispirillaceae bacterium]
MSLRMIILTIAGLSAASFPYSPEKLQNHFEWGEYRQLIDSLEPRIVATPCMIDSARCAKYHCYLGVAYFGTGRVGDARKQFLSALSFDPAVTPDSNYISDEIKELFFAARSDFIETQTRIRTRDSLLAAKQRAFNANLDAIKREELRKNRRTGSLMALSFITLGAAFTAIAGYEYYAARDPYDDFKAAAETGDRLSYDRLRPTIQRANSIITGCAVAAGLSETAGIVFTIRSMRMR